MHNCQYNYYGAADREASDVDGGPKVFEEVERPPCYQYKCMAHPYVLNCTTELRETGPL